MTKQEAIVNLSSIFNRGSSTDAKTEYFDGKKHDDLLDELLQYIQSSSGLIGNPRIFKTQSLNDRGVDLIVEYTSVCKIGIQIKSHFDVTQKEFALKVKAQMAESQSHGLDKWYLMICSPLKDAKGNYAAKISHLLNELSGFKTPYHIVYSPQQCVNIFTGAVIDAASFQSIKNQFYFDQVDWAQLIKELNTGGKVSSYLAGKERHDGAEAKTADAYLKYLGLGEQHRQSVVDDLNDLHALMKKLAKKTREFLYVVVSRSMVKGFRQIVLVPCQDLENYLPISRDKLRSEVGILENHGIAEIEDVDGDGIYYVVINKINPHYNILNDIKTFCQKTGKSLESIIVGLDFSQFDN